MKKIKKGDIVGRISYNKDIFFVVKDIKDKKNVLLEGVFVRIIADSDINDLELINSKEVYKKENKIEQEITKEENKEPIKANKTIETSNQNKDCYRKNLTFRW